MVRSFSKAPDALHVASPLRLFSPCFAPAPPFVRRRRLPAVSSSVSSSLPRSLFSSRVEPVRAGPGLSPAGPDAGLPQHGAPVRPAEGDVTAEDVTSPPCHPASRLVHRPRSQAVENALRTGVLGGACAYGRKLRSPQQGASGRRRGFVPTRRAGAPPAGPLTCLHLPILWPACGRLVCSSHPTTL